MVKAQFSYLSLLLSVWSGHAAKVEFAKHGQGWTDATNIVATGNSLHKLGYRYASGTETWDTFRYPHSGFPLKTEFWDSENTNWRVTLYHRSDQVSVAVPISRQVIFWGDEKDRVGIDANCRFGEFTFYYESGGWWHSHGIRVKSRGYVDSSDASTNDMYYWGQALDLAKKGTEVGKNIVDMAVSAKTGGLNKG